MAGAYKFLVVVAVVNVVAVRASAQTPCQATARNLISPSAPTLLAQIRAPISWQGDVIADGATCGHGDTVIVARIGRVPLRLVTPVLRTVYVGDLPDSRDNGPFWTGRGLNVFARVGIAADAGSFHFILAPEFARSENRPFNVVPVPAVYGQDETIPFGIHPGGDLTRSPFSSPWYTGQYSLDLPSRFGAMPLSQVLPGASAAWYSAGPVEAGVSTSSQGWGPGLRNELLLGSNAPGIPRLFVRTAHPVITRLGNFGGTVFVGTLSESPYFNSQAMDNLRTLGAWVFTWTRNDSSPVVLGIAHAGMRQGSWWGRPAVHGPADQINTFFARVRSPQDGFRAWTEIGRAGRLPTSGQFFAVPYQGIVYTLGVEQAVRSRWGTLLLTGEAADLEQPTDIQGQATQDFYTSPDIPQGWTQRGRLLGDEIGPGGQSQWVSGDWIARRWSAGLFFERVRWNEDAFLRQYLPYSNRHDVTIRAGVRGSVTMRGQDISLEVSAGHRLNYLFQNGTYTEAGFHTVDMPVPQVRISITPAAGHPQ